MVLLPSAGRTWHQMVQAPWHPDGLSNDLTHDAVWLGKKSRLSGPILRVAKVAQADANQAKPLVRSEADAL